MVKKSILTTQWGKLLISCIFLIITSLLSDFFINETLCMIFKVLYILGFSYPIYIIISLSYNLIRNSIKTFISYIKKNK